MSVEEQVKDVVRFQVNNAEERQDELIRLCREVASLDDDLWEQLSLEAQKWFNAAAESINEGLEVPEPSDYEAVEQVGETTEENEEQTVEAEAEPEQQNKEPEEANNDESDSQENKSEQGKKRPYQKPKGGRPKGSLSKKPKAGRPTGNRIFLHDSDRIIIMVEDNPKTPGSKAAKKWELYEDGMKVKDYLAKGGTRTTIRWDIRRGLIELDKRYRYRNKSDRKTK